MFSTQIQSTSINSILKNRIYCACCPSFATRAASSFQINCLLLQILLETLILLYYQQSYIWLRGSHLLLQVAFLPGCRTEPEPLTKVIIYFSISGCRWRWYTYNKSSGDHQQDQQSLLFFLSETSNDS